MLNFILYYLNTLLPLNPLSILYTSDVTTLGLLSLKLYIFKRILFLILIFLILYSMYFYLYPIYVQFQEILLLNKDIQNELNSLNLKMQKLNI